MKREEGERERCNSIYVNEFEIENEWNELVTAD